MTEQAAMPTEETNAPAKDATPPNPPPSPVTKVPMVPLPEAGPNATLAKAPESPRRGAVAGLLFAIALLLACAWADKPWEGRGWRDARAFQGGPVHLPVAADRATLAHGTREFSLRLADDGHTAVLPDIPMNAVVVHVHSRDPSDGARDLNVSVVSPWFGYGAGIAAVVAFFCLMQLFSSRQSAATGVGPLLEAISEPVGGMSLARVQLLVWLVVSFAILGALSVPLLDLPELDTSLAAIFGLSGLTTVLGAATSPSPPSANTPSKTDERPTLRDTVEDWRGGLDVSRVQCLMLTLLAAASVLAAFVTSLRVPMIPAGLLGLIGASQATYVATKAVKGAQPPTEKASEGS